MLQQQQAPDVAGDVPYLINLYYGDILIFLKCRAMEQKIKIKFNSIKILLKKIVLFRY